MEREARGDAELSRDFEAVMEAHEGALLRYATGLLRDAHAAQDLVQNVFVKLFRSRPAARGAAAYSVRAWLYRVAHNEAVDYLRHEGRLWCDTAPGQGCTFFVELRAPSTDLELP